jgi:hypothetical protein
MSRETVPISFSPDLQADPTLAAPGIELVVFASGNSPVGILIGIFPLR